MEQCRREAGNDCRVWRSGRERERSAQARLARAKEWWNWEPHRRQKSFLLATAQVRAAACGRRWGKTEALSVDLATLALEEARAGRPCRQLTVAPTEAQARMIGLETIRRVREALERDGGLADGLKITERSRPLTLTLTPRAGFPNGPQAILWFRTAGRDGRGLRGLSAHRILVDEAAYIPDGVLSEVLLPMLADVGGELTLTSTPAGRGGLFFRVFARGQAGGGAADDPHGLTYRAFQCPSEDNPHLDRAYLSAMADELGESRYAQEIDAQFVDDFGAVFPADAIENCLAADPEVHLENGDLISVPHPDHCYAAGIDWGRKRDFTVICVLDTTAPPYRLAVLQRMQGTGWETQAARAAETLARFLPRRTLADGNAMGDALAERLRAEIGLRVAEDDWSPPVTPFMFTPVTKQDLIDCLGLALSSRAVTFPAHAALVRELRGFEYCGASTTGRLRMAAAGAGHDDCVIALALAVSAAPVSAGARAPAEALLLGSEA